MTVIYALGLLVLMTLAYRSLQLERALGFTVLGVASWTLVEYLPERTSPTR